MSEHSEEGMVLVHCLECGATRLVSPREPGRCPLCGYQGWAYPEDLAPKGSPAKPSISRR